MRRRDFIKTGSLVITGLGTGTPGFSFVPDNFHEEGPYQNRIPFRKKPRTIREVVPGFLWADAGDFENYGGWAFDTQHVAFMGSSYLIAHGAGHPVKPARLTLNNVPAGRYRVWVRSRDWIPEHSPGRFSVAVNGGELSPSFGASGKSGWLWEDGGARELSGGTTILELRDKTGYYGRCSSIILTRDLDYRPPDDLEAFEQERFRLTGISDQPKEQPRHDVVVVGAGTAGVCAAIAAARSGAETALISDRPIVGGNASTEIGVPVQGAAQFHRFARESGIIEEAGRLGMARGWGNVMSRPFAQLIEEEPNLHLYSDLFLEDVEQDGDGRIRKAIARDTLSGERLGFPGRFFIDASGDGWLGYRSGADHRLGREAQREYNESNAPEKADDMTMSGCLRAPHESFKRCIFLRTAKTRSPKPFDPPPWIYDMPDFEAWQSGRGYDDKLERVARSGTWWLEHPGWVDDLWDPEGARDELLRVNFSFWHMMKNKWPERQRIANHELVYVPFSLGKRETRRLLGDYVLHENNCKEATRFDDAIGHSGWNLDVHAPKGILSTTGPFDFHDIIPLIQIPYRTLYSRNVDNLLMAGRNASVTHVAMGTVRVQGQPSLMGQAVGTAVGLARRHDTTPRGVYERHRSQLQQTLLKQDQFIPHVPNRDPEDLARRATVKASSFDRPEPANPFRNEEAPDAAWFALDAPRGVVFPWTPGKALNRIALRLRTEQGGEVTLRVREETNDGELTPGKELAARTKKVPANTDDWVAFSIKTTPQANRVSISLEGARAIEWRKHRTSLAGVKRFFRNAPDRRMVDGEAMAFDTSPREPFPDAAPLTPANAVNGIARPTFATPYASLQPYLWKSHPSWVEGETVPAMNMWQSARGEKLPQWIELEFDHPTPVSMVQCAFDTDLDVTLGKQRDAFPDACVRAYRIDCYANGAWTTVAREKMNFQRFRRHVFDTVATTRVRLTVESMHGLPQARLFEIRAYEKAAFFAAAPTGESPA